MMKLIMTATLILGLSVTGVAFVAQAQGMARSATIVSGIADLRTAESLTECQRVETHVSQSLRKIRDSFVPIMWLGVLSAMCGLTGLIAACRKQPTGGSST